jgi:hypothetical protein
MFGKVELTNESIVSVGSKADLIIYFTGMGMFIAITVIMAIYFLANM